MCSGTEEEAAERQAEFEQRQAEHEEEHRRRERSADSSPSGNRQSTRPSRAAVTD
jgi:hypothetical protein